jgi:hypothetical protein
MMTLPAFFMMVGGIVGEPCLTGRCLDRTTRAGCGVVAAEAAEDDGDEAPVHRPCT